MADIIQIRGDTTAAWSASNPVLADRELAIDTDLDGMKTGDGVTTWSSLPFLASGPTGPAGPDGRTILNGSGAPGGGLGANGDFYIDPSAKKIYGPKVGGTWPGGIDLSGANGIDGRTLLNGSGVPGSGLGANGDFYIDPTAKKIYGPKASGAWPAGIDIVGPAGTNGTNGLGVPAGGTEHQVLRKNSGTDNDTAWQTLAARNSGIIGYSGTAANGTLAIKIPVFVAAGETLKLASAAFQTDSGTCTAKIQIKPTGSAAADATGFTGMSLTSTRSTVDPADVTLNNGDIISVVISSASTPVNPMVAMELIRTLA